MSDITSRDYRLDETVTADTPEQMKALGDPLRLQIIDLVLERAMSVTELAGIVGRPKGTVAYHVDVLVRAGLLQVVRTRRVRAIEERLYGRVARTIVIDRPDRGVPFLSEVAADLERMHDPAALTDAASFTYRRARIPAERAAEYGARLHALALEFVDEPRDGDVEFGLYLAVFPTGRPVRPRS